MRNKELSLSELDSLGIFEKILRYWDWRMTVVFFGLGFLFVYYSSPPVESLDDPRVKVIEGIIVNVKGCILERRSGYVTLEDNNGIEHGARIKNCSEEERRQFLGKSIMTYRYLKNGRLTQSALEMHFDGKPYYTYEDKYGRHKFNAAILYFGIMLVPIALVTGHRWRREKVKILAREQCRQKSFLSQNSVD